MENADFAAVTYEGSAPSHVLVARRFQVSGRLFLRDLSAQSRCAMARWRADQPPTTSFWSFETLTRHQPAFDQRYYATCHGGGGARRSTTSNSPLDQTVQSRTCPTFIGGPAGSCRGIHLVGGQKRGAANSGQHRRTRRSRPPLVVPGPLSNCRFQPRLANHLGAGWRITGGRNCRSTSAATIFDRLRYTYFQDDNAPLPGITRGGYDDIRREVNTPAGCSSTTPAFERGDVVKREFTAMEACSICRPSPSTCARNASRIDASVRALTAGLQFRGAEPPAVLRAEPAFHQLFRKNTELAPSGLSGGQGA